MNKFLEICLLFGLIAIYLGDDNFNRDALNTHNERRKKHCAPPLQLSRTLNEAAQRYAEYMAEHDLFEHSHGPYGENIYWAIPYPTGSQVSRDWYNEEILYNYDNPGFTDGTGHFTQVVWVNTQFVGFGIANSSTGRTYVVANYDPPGNFRGQFPFNVKRPTC